MIDLLMVKFVVLCFVVVIAAIILAVFCNRMDRQIREIERNSESVEELTRKIIETEDRFTDLRSKLEFTTADEYWQVKRELDELKRRLKAKQNG